MVSPHQTFLVERRSKRTLAERRAFPSPPALIDRRHARAHDPLDPDYRPGGV